MKPPFPFHGAKGRLAPWIASLIPDHLAYVEPFAGSAAVLMAKPVSKVEVLNDINGDVVNFWRVLRDETEALVTALDLTPYAREEFVACRDGRTEEPVERARQFFVQMSMGFNASLDPANGFSASTVTSNGKPRAFINRVARLPEVAARLRGVEVDHRDALEVIARWDSPNAVLYLDPPYLGDTRTTHGKDYGHHDSRDADFHDRLLDAVTGTKARVLLSGYESPAYARLREAGWRALSRHVTAPTSNRPGQATARRVETVWLNYDPLRDEDKALL